MSSYITEQLIFLVILRNLMHEFTWEDIGFKLGYSKRHAQTLFSSEKLSVHQMFVLFDLIREKYKDRSKRTENHWSTRLQQHIDQLSLNFATWLDINSGHVVHHHGLSKRHGGSSQMTFASLNEFFKRYQQELISDSVNKSNLTY